MAVRISKPHSATIRAYGDAGDEQLMQLFQHGDNLAFRELMERHRGMICQLAQKFFGSKTDMDDIFQDISLTLWQKRDAWTPGIAKFSTWLYRIVTNRCIDLQRQQKAKFKDILDEDLISGIASAEDMMSSAQLSSRLISLIGDLPVQQKKALHLFYYEDTGISGICETMNLTEQAVRSLLKRGKQALRHSMPLEQAYA